MYICVYIYFYMYIETWICTCPCITTMLFPLSFSLLSSAVKRAEIRSRPISSPYADVSCARICSLLIHCSIPPQCWLSPSAMSLGQQTRASSTAAAPRCTTSKQTNKKNHRKELEIQNKMTRYCTRAYTVALHC